MSGSSQPDEAGAANSCKEGVSADILEGAWTAAKNKLNIVCVAKHGLDGLIWKKKKRFKQLKYTQ